MAPKYSLGTVLIVAFALATVSNAAIFTGTQYPSVLVMTVGTNSGATAGRATGAKIEFITSGDNECKKVSSTLSYKLKEKEQIPENCKATGTVTVVKYGTAACTGTGSDVTVTLGTKDSDLLHTPLTSSDSSMIASTHRIVGFCMPYAGNSTSAMTQFGYHLKVNSYDLFDERTSRIQGVKEEIIVPSGIVVEAAADGKAAVSTYYNMINDGIGSYLTTAELAAYKEMFSPCIPTRFGSAQASSTYGTVPTSTPDQSSWWTFLKYIKSDGSETGTNLDISGKVTYFNKRGCVSTDKVDEIVVPTLYDDPSSVLTSAITEFPSWEHVGPTDISKVTWPTKNSKVCQDQKMLTGPSGHCVPVTMCTAHEHEVTKADLAANLDANCEPISYCGVYSTIADASMTNGKRTISIETTGGNREVDSHYYFPVKQPATTGDDILVGVLWAPVSDFIAGTQDLTTNVNAGKFDYWVWDGTHTDTAKKSKKCTKSTRATHDICYHHSDIAVKVSNSTNTLMLTSLSLIDVPRKIGDDIVCGPCPLVMVSDGSDYYYSPGIYDASITEETCSGKKSVPYSSSAYKSTLVPTARRRRDTERGGLPEIMTLPEEPPLAQYPPDWKERYARSLHSEVVFPNGTRVGRRALFTYDYEDQIELQACRCKAHVACGHLEYIPTTNINTSTFVKTSKNQEINKCVRCNPGYYLNVLARGMTDERCAPCAHGYFDHDADPLTECKRCPAGKYTSDVGSVFCKKPEEGFYVPESQSSQEPCSTPTCADGMFATRCYAWEDSRCDELPVKINAESKHSQARKDSGSLVALIVIGCVGGLLVSIAAVMAIMHSRSDSGGGGGSNGRSSKSYSRV